jgi:hypothetical protein
VDELVLTLVTRGDGNRVNEQKVLEIILFKVYYQHCQMPYATSVWKFRVEMHDRRAETCKDNNSAHIHAFLMSCVVSEEFLMDLPSSFDRPAHKSRDTSHISSLALHSMSPCLHVIGPLCYHLLLLTRGDFIRLN